MAAITEQTGRASQVFGRQVDQLMSTAAKASETAKHLDDAHDRAHTGKFLEHTTYVIEQLHSLAVDIARIFQPSVEEELWKRYYKGDQGVFLRHITFGDRDQAGQSRFRCKQIVEGIIRSAI